MLFVGGGVPRVLVPIALAGGVSLPGLWPWWSLDSEGWLVQMQELRTQGVGDCRNDFRWHTQATGLVVPGNLVDDEPEERSQCLGLEADSWTGQLRDRMDMAA